MTPEEKIEEIKKHIELIEVHLAEGNKRLAIGSLDVVKESSIEAIWLLITQIELEEGKF